MANIDVQILVACELAAVGVAKHLGSQDKVLVDQIAVSIIRDSLQGSEIDGLIVNGEGGLEDAPALFNGEKLGKMCGRVIDIAVDPIEGTRLAAANKPGSVSTIAYCDRGKMQEIPEMYMEKLFVAGEYKDVVSLENSLEQNVKAMQKIAGSRRLKAVVLDRARHAKYIEQLKDLNVDVKLITDGDVIGATEVSLGYADFLYGTGGSPEGAVMAALAIGGGSYFEGRLVSMTTINDSNKVGDRSIAEIAEVEHRELARLNLSLNKVYKDRELVNDEKARFFCTGVTGGLTTERVTLVDGLYHTTSVMASYGTTRLIKTTYNIKKLPKRYVDIMAKHI